MFSCMMCDVLYEVDFGEGVIFLIDIVGALLYCVVLLLSYKYFCCEVIFGVMLLLIEQMMVCCEIMISLEFCECIVELGALEVSSFWY